MIDPDKVFLKYGFAPPTYFSVPSKSDILKYVKDIKNSPKEETTPEYLYFSALALSLIPDRLFIIQDSECFSREFGFKLNFSRLHPKLIRKIPIHFLLRGNDIVLFERFEYIVSSFADTELDLYLHHFSPEYRLQNLFSSTVKEELRNELVNYVKNEFSAQLRGIDLTSFLAELYPFLSEFEEIKQSFSQNKQKDLMK